MFERFILVLCQLVWLTINTNLTNGVREQSCAPFFYADQVAHYHYSISEIKERSITEGNSFKCLDFIIKALNYAVCVAVFHGISNIFHIIFCCLYRGFHIARNIIILLLYKAV